MNVICIIWYNLHMLCSYKDMFIVHSTVRVGDATEQISDGSGSFNEWDQDSRNADRNLGMFRDRDLNVFSMELGYYTIYGRATKVL